MITAPFNFVPLSEKVFFPDWAESVSHDVPFEDAESGVIDVTITAKSPIFIRDHENSEEFCNYKGEYYIPATSVKGMVRNVLEIMSFSKMSQFNDNTYAVRDLSNQELYMSKMKPKNIFCGWLKKIDGKYYIEDCGIPGRIRLNKIDRQCSTKFGSNFDGKSDNHKTAKFKYELFSDINLPTNFRYEKNHNGRDVYIVGDDKEGTIVFTGQPSARKEGKTPSGKIYEFIFFEPKEDIEINQKIYNNFKFAYFDGKSNMSEDWKWRKEQLHNGEKIPVFFQKDKDGNIIHFGLSYLYKLPYNYSIGDAIKQKIETITRKDKEYIKLDLSETIFGTTQKSLDETKDYSLKGRVQFSHFKADIKPPIFKTITTVLGSPRASYYPIYIKQNYKVGESIVENERYNTLMDKNSHISGWKRYPLHQNIPNPKRYNKEVDSATTFRPLGNYDKESNKFNEFTFSGKLRYHNPKQVELGAIISALTFHGCSDDFYHNIGMAKSLGFGKINIELSLKAEKEVQLLTAFENKMKEFDEGWIDSQQLNELFAMADKNLAIEHQLKYLTLDPKEKIDEFRDKKNHSEYLPLTSRLSKSKNRIKSILRQETIDCFIKKEMDKQKILEENKEKIKQEQELLNNTPQRNSKAFKDAIKGYVIRNITLPYYDYSDLKKVFEEREDDIISDDIYDAYMDLVDKKSFKSIEKLLLKREKNKATDLELAKLYQLLKEG